MARRLAVLLGSAALVVPLVEPVEQHTGAVAHYLLTMAATAMATPVQAQTSETLVSNIDQSVAREQEIGGNLADALTGGTGRGLFVAHPFTTGRVSGGYTLTSVTLPAKEHGLVDGISITVSLHSNSSGQPGSQIAVLGTQTVPGGTSSAQNLVFNAPANTILRPNTTYFLYIQPGNLADIPVTDRTDVDNDSHFGWSMGRSLTRNYIYVGNNLWFPEDEDGYDQMNGNVRVRIEGVPILSEVTVAVVDSDTGYREGDTVPFTLSRTGDVSNALSVAVSWDADSGLVSNDLLSQTTVTFAKNERTVTVSAATIDDEVFNETERLAFTLSAVAAATSATPAYRVGQQSSAEVEIADNDPLAVVTVTASASSIAEGEAVTFTFSREEGVTKQVSIDVLWDAIGVTYDPRPSRTVTFPANQRTVAVTVQTADDETYSPGSRGTFGPDIFPDTNDPPSYSLGDSSLAAVSVTDNDPAPVVTLVLTPSTIAEAGGVSVVTATLDRPSSSSMNIDVSVESGAPVSLSSYNLLIIFSGTTASADIYDAFGVLQPPVTVTARDNDVDGPDRQVLVMGVVRGSGDMVNPEPATLTITDDDLTMVSIAPVTESVSEGDAAEFRLSLTTPATEELVVDVSVTGTGNVIAGTAPSSVTFAVGDSTATLRVPTAEDSVAEDDRTVTATVMADSDTPATYEVESPSEAMVTVTNSDTMPPTVTSIARQTPGTSPTNADSLTWRVTFSETVTNVDAADFTVGDSTATVTNVQAVSGETGVYDMTISGGDLAGFNGTVTLGFASDQDIADEAGNGLSNIMPTGANGNSYVVDNTAPQVVSITRQDPTTSPINADSLTWRVTFSEAVTNVDAADFTVGGGSTATVTSVEEVSGETGVYDVTVSGGDLSTFDGTVTLTFAAGPDPDAREEESEQESMSTDPPPLLGSIQQPIGDEAGNALIATMPTGTNDNSYVVDHTAPTVTAITRQTPTTSPTNANSLTWRVTFSEAVTNVDGADFTVGSTPPMSTPPTVSNVEAVDGETGVHDVTVSGGDLATFDGTVTLAFAGGQDIQDPAANPLATTPPGTNDNSYEVDNVAPTLTYTAPMFLIVGTAISPIAPSSTDTDITSTSATGLPNGLMIHPTTGEISGTPTTPNTSPSEVVVTVTDSAGNSDTIAFDFPAVVQPGVSVAPPSLSPDEGETAAYTLVLDTQPAGAVTITPTRSGDSGGVSVSLASLIFTTANWDTPRTLSVMGVQDDNANDEMVTISHSVSGYGGVTSADAVTVSVTDDDTAGVSVQPPSVSTDEGETAAYTVKLVTQPSGNVTITPTNGDSGAVSLSPASLTFTTTNWDTPRTVTVTGVQDDDAKDETVTVSHSVSGYGAVSIGAAVTVSVTDDDTAGVSVSPVSINTDEGGTVTYTVKLDTLPSGPVTITPMRSGDSGAVSLSPARLTVTPSNWDTPWTVSVTGVQDDDANDETVTVSHSVSGYGAVSVGAVVIVSVMDGDTAGVSVSPVSVNTDEGGTVPYTLQLSTEPTGPVTITPMRSGDSGAVSLSPASLTVTPSNWDTPRTVTVTGVQDDDANDETVSISHSVSGYGGVTSAAAVTVSVDDDDTPGVSITPASVNPGEGETATYTLQLSTEPTGHVTITPTNGDSGAVSLSPARLTVTPSNWNMPQAVTVTVLQDDDSADETVSISHSVSGYGGVSVGAVVIVSVTDDNNHGMAVTDNDTARVRITPPNLNLDEGGTATYTVTLSTQPAGNVTITPTNGDSGAVSLSPATLSFTPSTWDTPRTVAVTALQDDDSADEMVSISHSVSGYGGVTSAAAVTVSVTDNAADTTAPRVTSIERQTPTTSPTNADSLTWRVTFSETVANVDAAAFMVSGSTATVISMQAMQGEMFVHDVTVSGGDLADLNGTVTLGFATSQTIQDQAGHPLTDTIPTGTNHNSYLVDNTTMETTEPLAAAWLAHMGRSVAQQVMDAVAKRSQVDPTPGLQLSLAGEPLNTTELSSLADHHGLLAKVLGFEGVTRQQLAEGTGFALSPAGAPGGVSLWGEAALSSFATTDHDLSLEADVFTTLLGGDWRSGQWQVGAALAHSTGSGTYHANPGVAHGAGEVSSRVTGFYPYVHYAVTPQFSLWGVVGSGRGEWSLTPDGGRQQDMPLTLSLAAVGMEGLLRDGGSQGFTLKSRMDALWMGGSADAAEAADAEGDGEDVLEVDDVAAEVSRLRLGLQASRSFPMGDHAVITPSLEMGLRQDGGDADTGFGLDMGAGLRWHHHRHGFSAQLQGRSLLTHMAEDFSDQGLSLAISWDPTPDSTLGPSFSLEQAMGGPATAQVEALLGGSATAASINNDGEGGNVMGNRRLALRWGYGLSAFRDAFSLTPHLAVGFSSTERDTSLGWTLAPLGASFAAPSTTVSLEMTRREPTAHHHNAGPHHSLELQLDSRF